MKTMRNRTTAEGDIFIATFNEKNRTVSDEKLSRTFADAGTDLDTLRRMMRHSHINTTVNHYLKADPRKMKSATTAVDDALDL